MEPIRIRRSVPPSGRLQIKVPKEFAKEIDILIFPSSPKKIDSEESEWAKIGMYSLFKDAEDDDVDWEDFFGVKTG